MRSRNWIGALVMIVVTHWASCAERDLGPLRAAVEREITASGKQVGVVLKHLESGQELVLNDDVLYPMASTYKIPIMVETFRQVRAGKFSLDDRVTMTEFDRNTVNYLNEFGPGFSPTIRDLITMMIVVTDSSATDMLLRRVGPENVTATMRRLGLRSLTVNRTVEDIIWDYFGVADKEKLERKPFAERATLFRSMYMEKQTPERVKAAIAYYTGNRDVTRPSDMARLLEQIFRGRAVDAEASRQMLNILYRQRLNFNMPRLLPRNTPVAHKTGNLGTVADDVGIIDLPDGTHLLAVIFTKYVPSPDSTGPIPAEATDVIPRIARDAFDFFTEGKFTLIPKIPTAHSRAPLDQFRSAAAARQQLDLLSREEDIEIGVAALNLGNGNSFYYNADSKFPLSFTAMLPVAAEVFRQIETGRVRLSDRWISTERDRATFGGYMKEMGPGLNPSVADLLDLSVVGSDYSAGDMLLRHIGIAAVDRLLKDSGLEHTSISRTNDEVLWDFLGTPGNAPVRTAPFLERYAQFQSLLVAASENAARAHARFYTDSRDSGTPRDMMILVQRLAAGKLLKPNSTHELLDLLALASTRAEGLLPSNYFGEHWTIAHRPGYMGGIANDIFLLARPDTKVVVAVFTLHGRSGRLGDAGMDNFGYDINFSPYPELVNAIAKRVLELVVTP